ncbi:hypothetical protein GTZ99_16010 [Novosphingobium sp. FSY-8]|uniref:Uncharacterized protein n=1 Tax=Novosphingobium ovatum TaxID=1908523 RepID=A0ABW9XHM8_9SPHN|nr:hypothetical protein [Novosphingobium ovatum]NBC38058.1 hypothetical protein [Novosphingobium ovatum]
MRRRIDALGWLWFAGLGAALTHTQVTTRWTYPACDGRDGIAAAVHGLILPERQFTLVSSLEYVVWWPAYAANLVLLWAVFAALCWPLRRAQWPRRNAIKGLVGLIACIGLGLIMPGQFWHGAPPFDAPLNAMKPVGLTTRTGSYFCTDPL